jgi:predicted nucleic acid-binding Zn ribbon protein
VGFRSSTIRRERRLGGSGARIVGTGEFAAAANVRRERSARHCQELDHDARRRRHQPLLALVAGILILVMPPLYKCKIAGRDLPSSSFPVHSNLRER